MSAQEQVLGYDVIVTGNPEMPYELHGPRGARYGLLRNIPNPDMLFAVNLRRMGAVSRLGWFTDKDGALRAVGS